MGKVVFVLMGLFLCFVAGFFATFLAFETFRVFKTYEPVVILGIGGGTVFLFVGPLVFSLLKKIWT
jgi:hypothetical protein